MDTKLPNMLLSYLQESKRNTKFFLESITGQSNNKPEVYDIEKKKNTIICGDCLKELKKFPDECFDLIIVDPPYMISRKQKYYGLDHVGKRTKDGANLSFDFGDWDYFSSLKEYLNFTKKWLKECYRILKETGQIYSFFCKERHWFLWKWWEEFGGKSRNVIAWHKTNPVPQIPRGNYQSSIELIFWGTKGRKHTFNCRQCHNFIETPICAGKERCGHPTQKPEKVIEYLMNNSSKEGDLVLDPFAGSCTTAVVAKKLKRNWIMIEINPKYRDIGQQRVDAIPEPLF